jgi:hypothetical protein
MHVIAVRKKITISVGSAYCDNKESKVEPIISNTNTKK